MKIVHSVIAMALFLTAAAPVCATQLISNGGFESGLSGWTVSDQGSGTWSALSGTSAPFSGMPTVGAASGGSYAMTDQSGPGAHALTQSFTVAPSASVILSFAMFINNYAGAMSGGTTLDMNQQPNQYGRVDILSAGASAFDTTGGVLSNLFIGGGNGLTNPYSPYSFDITSIVGNGGTFQLRFAEVDNQLFFNMGLDDVSIDAATGTAPVPEPGTMMLLGAGFLGLAVYGKRRKNA
ncbi:MAG: hypothetical protein A2075_18910 [Geobacteraceae bacterium GWC2_58_44]|nr:MAG: hypothetical protein A2075_18910 [Geobacteraceae bacterium GWC2_58_44]